MTDGVSRNPAVAKASEPLTPLPEAPQPSSQSVARHTSCRGSFGELLEDFLATQDPVRLWGFAIISGFILLFMSTLAGIDLLNVTQHDVTKQLGIWCAPNWSIIYLVLFPLYLVSITTQASSVRRFLKSSSIDSTIIIRDGSPSCETQLIDCLKSEFRKTSGVFVFLAVAVAIVTAVGWLQSCAKPLVDWNLGDQVVGWANAQVALGDAGKSYRYSSLFYTAIAYIWMGMALYIYLGYLITALVYSNFFRKLSQSQVIVDGDRTLCMVLTKSLTNTMSAFLFNLLALCLLGLISAFLIRLDVAFLYSDEKSILDFWFGDFDLGVMKSVLLIGYTIQEGKFQNPDAKDMDQYISLASVAVTVATFVTCAWLILDALKQARKFTLDMDPAFLKMANLTIDDKYKIKIRNANELAQVIPDLKLFSIIALGVILCGVFPRFGIFFSSLMALALFRYLYRLVSSLK